MQITLPGGTVTNDSMTLIADAIRQITNRLKEFPEGYDSAQERRHCQYATYELLKQLTQLED